MMLQIKRWLAPPVFPGDETRTRRAEVLDTTLLTSMALTLCFIVGNLAGGHIPLAVNAVDIVVFAVCFVLRRWAYQGRIDLAGSGLLAVGLVSSTLAIAMMGTIRVPSAGVYLLIIIVAGLVFDLRGMIVMTVLCALAIAGLMVAENMGWLPRPDYTVTITQWITYIVLFAWAGSLTLSSLQSIRQALARANQVIAERKRTDETLRESEERFREFFEHETNYCYRISPEGIILDLNPSALRALGYASKEEIVGKPLLTTVYAPAGRDRARQLFLKWKETGKLSNEELTIITKTGEERTVTLNASMVRDAEGKLLHSVSIQTDITERKRTEEALQESEQKYRRILETMIEGAWIIDANALTTFTNSRMAEMLGYSVEEMLGQSLFEFMDEEGKQIAAHKVERRQQGIKEIHDFKFLRKDGSAFWALLCTNPLTDDAGQYQGALAMVADITERRRAEDTLRESEERFRTIYENAPVLIDGFDKNGRCILWNSECEKVFGWTINEINSHDEPLVLFYPDPNERKEVIDTIISKPEKTFREWHPLNRDGKELTVAGANFQLPNEMVINIGYDITERRRMEEALRVHEERFRIAQDLSLQAFTIFHSIRDAQGQIVDFEWTYANPMAGQILGHSSDWLIGQRLLDVLPGNRENRALFERYVRIVETGQGDEVELEYHSEGISGWFRNMAVKLDDGIAISFSEITERKAAEEKIRLLNAELEKLAATDYLTNLYARRYFMQRGAEEFKRAARTSQPLALLMLDIDELKKVNDIYGHEAGDLALQQAAAVMKYCLREIDVLGRIGGDEFAVLLPNTALEEAVLLAERVRQSVANTSFKKTGEALTITISVGVAAFSDEMSIIDDLLRNADAALYHAKNSGRNCVMKYKKPFR